MTEYEKKVKEFSWGSVLCPMAENTRHLFPSRVKETKLRTMVKVMRSHLPVSLLPSCVAWT